MFEKIMEKIVNKPDIFGTDYELGELKAINKQKGWHNRIAYRQVETLAFIPPSAEIKHPTVYKFITAMQKEQKNVRVRLCQIQAGDLNEDKTKYQVNKDKRILKLVQNYSKDKIKSYFNDFLCLKRIWF
jgi:hypothetical protein